LCWITWRCNGSLSPLRFTSFPMVALTSDMTHTWDWTIWSFLRNSHAVCHSVGPNPHLPAGVGTGCKIWPASDFHPWRVVGPTRTGFFSPLVGLRAAIFITKQGSTAVAWSRQSSTCLNFLNFPLCWLFSHSRSLILSPAWEQTSARSIKPCNQQTPLSLNQRMGRVLRFTIPYARPTHPGSPHSPLLPSPLTMMVSLTSSFPHCVRLTSARSLTLLWDPDQSLTEEQIQALNRWPQPARTIWCVYLWGKIWLVYESTGVYIALCSLCKNPYPCPHHDPLLRVRGFTRYLSAYWLAWIAGC
jgi:hypothetical protein